MCPSVGARPTFRRAACVLFTFAAAHAEAAVVRSTPFAPVRPLTAYALPMSAIPMIRDVSRDKTAVVLTSAGIPERLSQRGLILWQIISITGRNEAPRVSLTFGLPADGRPFDRTEDPLRKKRLSELLGRYRPELQQLFAGALGVPVEAIMMNERLIESCCGADCQACLLTKPEHAATWTGMPRRPASPR